MHKFLPIKRTIITSFKSTDIMFPIKIDSPTLTKTHQNYSFCMRSVLYGQTNKICCYLFLCGVLRCVTLVGWRELIFISIILEN